MSNVKKFTANTLEFDKRYLQITEFDIRNIVGKLLLKNINST